ncbi:MAG: transcriptional repressor [Methanobacterium sp.]|jgi:Fe2+ or Zn2+ uptake regulation protein
MENRLRDQKIKITPQRIELIKKLKELKTKHPSFNEVYKAIKNTHPNVSRSTVHKNLKLLEKIGIIQSFHYKGETRYEMNTEPHVNLVEANGNIKDIKNINVQQHLQEIERIIKEDEGIELKKILIIVEQKE